MTVGTLQGAWLLRTLLQVLVAPNVWPSASAGAAAADALYMLFEKLTAAVEAAADRSSDGNALQKFAK